MEEKDGPYQIVLDAMDPRVCPMICRGRWKGGKQIVDMYIDINLPLSDIMGASKLCGSDRAYKYIWREDTFSKDWLVE